MDVIAETLAYIKSVAITEINRPRLSDIGPSDIHWVLTVPAIWTDIAKERKHENIFKLAFLTDSK